MSWQTSKTSSDYAPAVAHYIDGVVGIWPDGRQRRGRVRADRIMSAEQAREALQQGAKRVFVATAEDARAVMGGEVV